MKAIILNYGCVCIEVVELPASIDTNEQVEDYLASLDYRLDEINYMTTNDNCPIYDCSEDSDNIEEPLFVIR